VPLNQEADINLSLSPLKILPKFDMLPVNNEVKLSPSVSNFPRVFPCLDDTPTSLVQLLLVRNYLQENLSFAISLVPIYIYIQFHIGCTNHKIPLIPSFGVDDIYRGGLCRI